MPDDGAEQARPPARDLVPTAAGQEVARLAAEAAVYAGEQMAPATRRAYESDWADFAAWCDAHRAQSLPAAPATVALYLTDRAAKLSVATLERRVAAIRTIHKYEDLAPPASGALRAVWSGIRRRHGRPPRQKRALITADLRRLVQLLPAGVAGVRDKALLLVCYAAALRRHELADMVLDERGRRDQSIRLLFVAGGFEVAIDRSKGDQEGEGAVVAVPRGRTKLCPVRALEDWLAAAEVRSGPVFRPVDRHGRVGPGKLSGAAVAAIVKRAAARAKIDPDQIGGHSLRAGLVTQAVLDDVATAVIMKQTRHAKVDTMRGYIRAADRFKNNAAGKVGL